jgi:hypothetical protein
MVVAWINGLIFECLQFSCCDPLHFKVNNVISSKYVKRIQALCHHVINCLYVLGHWKVDQEHCIVAILFDGEATTEVFDKRVL